MHRTHTCGELNINHVNTEVTLSGWVHRSRDLGGMTFIDLRDRYGITQLAFNMEVNKTLCEQARKLGREFVVKATGKVMERSSKNLNIPTGEIEIIVDKLEVLNASKTPPFTLENETDGGEELRMKYRYLDLRREVVRKNLQHRHEVAQATREYLSSVGFLEVETPVLIKSTPEGARDFVVPSRMNRGEFYALPQSPQTFKQLLMVGGFDKYFQIVKCFRDEDLRADRQPEFTQIDCEMSFVEQQDVLDTFEGMTKHLFKKVLDRDLDEVPHMTYADAMKYYGSDKPDIRFDMRFVEMNDLVKDTEFVVFKSVIDNGGKVIGINAKGCADYSRKQLDALTDFVKAPHRGMRGLVYVKFEADGIKSSAQKFFTDEQFKAWGEAFGAEEGDLLLVLAGDTDQTRKALNDLRLEMGNRLGLRDKNVFKPLWVVDFPLLEWDEDTQRFYAMHHPFTAPKPEDMHIIESGDKSKFGEIRANAYDLVINGVEIGGGSIRIHDRGMQQTMFDLLGMSKEESEEQFGFIMQAFEYGAPPHGGLAFGFDRLCSLLGGSEIIRDFIAFPKNNAGRDVMIDAPSQLANEQLDELGIELKPKED